MILYNNIKVLIFAKSIDRIKWSKLFFRATIIKLIYLIVLILSYFILIINYKLFFYLHNVFLNFLIIIDPVVQKKFNIIKLNLVHFFTFDINNTKVLNKLSKKSLNIRYRDFLKFNNIFLFLIRKKRFLDICLLKKINNCSGINLSNIEERKIIFCHMHTNDKIESIVKIESIMNKNLITLYVQRGHSEYLTKFIKKINILLEKKYVYTHNPFESNNRLGLIKKVKKSDIVHMYVDLSQALAYKSFSTSKITFLGKKANIVNGFATIAILTKSICIPVFTKDDTINLLESIDTLHLKSADMTQELIQNIYDKLSIELIKNPENWNYLADMETYFRNIKLREQN